MGGSGASSKSTKVVGMARLKGAPSTVADAKEVRAILNEALNVIQNAVQNVQKVEKRRPILIFPILREKSQRHGTANNHEI